MDKEYVPVGYRKGVMETFHSIPSNIDDFISILNNFKKRWGNTAEIRITSNTNTEYSSRTDSSYTTSYCTLEVLASVPIYSEEDNRRMMMDRLNKAIERRKK